MNMPWKIEPPQTDGPYLWRQNYTGQVIAVIVVRLDKILKVLIPSDVAFEDEYVPVDSIGGDWIRLVPADE